MDGLHGLAPFENTEELERIYPQEKRDELTLPSS